MKPEPFADQTRVLGAPQGWDAAALGPCAGLPVRINDYGFDSYWSVSWREWFGLLFGRHVRLTVASAAHPPVALNVEPRP